MKRSAILRERGARAGCRRGRAGPGPSRGWIAGAGLDVFEEEPKVHSRARPLTNVVLAPHIASASLDTRVAMATLAVRNCLSVLDGKAPLTPVS